MQNKNNFTEKSTNSKEETIPVIFFLNYARVLQKKKMFPFFFKADTIILNLKPASIGTEKEKPDQKPKNIDDAKIFLKRKSIKETTAEH